MDSEWERRKDAVRSVSKCAYIGGESCNEQTMVQMDGTRLKPGQKKTYLGLTLTVERVRGDRSEGRIRGAGTETVALTKCGWSNLGLDPNQIGPEFNALVRSKFRYCLPLVTLTRGMSERVEKWCEVEMKALIKTRMRLHPTTKPKLSAVQQWENLEELVVKEARR